MVNFHYVFHFFFISNQSIKSLAAMSNLIQESSEPPNPEDTFDPFPSQFSTLCLNPSAVDPRSHPPPCSACFRRHSRPSATPMKRPSPMPSQHPSTTTTSKKLFLDHQQADSIPFSKIDLPIPFGPSLSHPTPLSPLRRSVSDPTEARNFSPPPMIPSPAKRLCLNSTLPPLPLRRTVSDPNPSPGKTSEPPIQLGKANDLIVEDSTESKRLKRIKNRLMEMNQRWNEVMSEEEQDENDTKKKDCHKGEEEDEETVGVERVGDSLMLRLKCPCGKRFEILLCGRSCFYKLL